MSVKDTLDKIVERHPDVIGAMVLYNGQVQHNLEPPYDIVSIDVILDMLADIFEQTSMLADEGFEFGELMLDFPNHSFIVRTIDGGLLAVLAPSLQRGQLVKLHVGLGIFGKAVQKSLEEAAHEPEQAVEAAPVQAESAPQIDAEPERVVSQPIIEPDQRNSSEDGAAEGGFFSFGKKRRGGFRGTKELLASRVQEAMDATSEPQPKEPEVSADGVPLNPDGTPKKKRIYRGQVFYE
ncbi:MAG: hypothetical protein AAF222_09580 [Pseudomonadota bacterium]